MQGYNLLVYCGNNPINRIDISGADSTQFDDNQVELDETALRGSSIAGNNSQKINAIFSESGQRIASRNYAGSSGKTEVHHNVERCQTIKSGFSRSQIQADNNLVVLDYSIHRAVSGFYSSKPESLNGLRVRDWLAGQSFEFQTEFGWKVTNYYYSLMYK